MPLFVVAALLMGGCVKPRVWRAAVQQARATGVVDVDVSLRGDPRFCSDVVRHMRSPHMVRCSPGAAVSVDADLGVGGLDHSWNRERYSREYVTGTVRLDNPEFRQARQRLRHAEIALADAEERLADCKDGTSEEFEDRVRARREQRDRAERQLSETPRYIERDEMAEYSWVAVHHTWIAGYDWTANVDAAGAKSRRTGAGDLTFRGTDQRAFPPANVPGHRAYEPDPDAIASAAYERAARGVAELLDDQLARAAAVRESTCPPEPRLEDDTQWLACRAEVRLLRGEWVRP